MLEQVDVRVGTIESVSAIAGSDKLVQLRVSGEAALSQIADGKLQQIWRPTGEGDLTLQLVEWAAYLADILAKLVNGWPAHNLDELLPWAWAEQYRVRLAA